MKPNERTCNWRGLRKGPGVSSSSLGGDRAPSGICDWGLSKPQSDNTHEVLKAAHSAISAH